MAETLEEAQARLTLEIQGVLAETDPDKDYAVGTVNYDLIVKPLAALFATREEALDTLRSNFSLLQVLNSEDPDDTLVDLLLSNYGVVRNAGSVGTGILNIFINSELPVTIPVNSTFTCGNIQVQPIKTFVGQVGTITAEDTENISYVQARLFEPGVWVFAITAQTVEVLDTVLSAGETCSYSLNTPAITRIEVASTFVGGAPEETTNELLARAQTNINAKVTTGKANIQSLLLTNTSGIDVIGSQPFGFGDDLMIRDAANSAGISSGGHVDVYVKNTAVPLTTDAILPATDNGDETWNVVIPNDPYAGAYGVLSVTYDGNTVNTNLTHTLGYETDPTAPDMSEPLHARYSQYQTLTITFPEISGLESLSEADVTVSIFWMPGVRDLQTYMQSCDVRSYSFDTLVKAVIPVVISTDVTIDYPQGISAPTEEEISQSISDIVNLKAIGTEALYTSDIVYAVRLVFPEATVRMPINLFARIFLPDGTQAYTTDQHHIKVAPIQEGITYENCAFSCFPTNVNITLNEIPSC
jgi:hypothetical protein